MPAALAADGRGTPARALGLPFRSRAPSNALVWRTLSRLGLRRSGGRRAHSAESHDDRGRTRPRNPRVLRSRPEAPRNRPSPHRSGPRKCAGPASNSAGARRERRDMALVVARRAGCSWPSRGYAKSSRTMARPVRFGSTNDVGSTPRALEVMGVSEGWSTRVEEVGRRAYWPAARGSTLRARRKAAASLGGTSRSPGRSAPSGSRPVAAGDRSAHSSRAGKEQSRDRNGPLHQFAHGEEAPRERLRQARSQDPGRSRGVPSSPRRAMRSGVLSATNGRQPSA